jgi:ethanolamine utilization microcompartment shell protein EutL
MAHYRISMGVAVSVLLAWPLQLGVWAATAPKVVEEVDFATSCGPAAQHNFRHAVWTLHSFWYPEALKDFTAVTEAEPVARSAIGA